MAWWWRSGIAVTATMIAVAAVAMTAAASMTVPVTAAVTVTTTVAATVAVTVEHTHPFPTDGPYECADQYNEQSDP